MKDILESGIVIGGLFALIFLFGCFITYIGFIQKNISIPTKEWKCTKAIIINDDPSKTECIIYVRTKDIPK